MVRSGGWWRGARARRAPRELRRTAWTLPLAVVVLCWAQAVALVGGAVALLVLAATSQAVTSTGFLVVDVTVALLVAALLSWAAPRPWARTPILLTELFAVLVSTEVWSSGRPVLALAIGIPAAVAVVLVVVASKPPPRTR